MTVPRRLPSGFVGPWWLERQRDFASGGFAPAEAGVDHNRTHRDAVLVGNLDSPDRLAVDPRGLVVTSTGSWSVDWWIGGDERWHLPSREAAVRQELVDGAPVVATTIRVPGGDAIQRVFAVEDIAGGSGVEGIDGPAAIIEIENASPVPFAVALAIRPYGLAGIGEINEISYVAGETGGTVRVDNTSALVFAKAPARFAFGDARADSADTVLRGAARTEPPAGRTCSRGLSQGAFVFPLPHTAVLRAFVPLDPDRSASAGVAGLSGGSGASPGRQASSGQPSRTEAAVPRAETVAKGWDAHAARGARIELPDPQLRSALAGARRGLLLALTGGNSVLTGAGLGAPGEPGAEARHDVVSAMQEFGLDDAEDVLMHTATERASDGRLGPNRVPDAGSLVAHGATLGLLARQVELAGPNAGAEMATALAETAAAAGLWLRGTTSPGRRRHRRRRNDRWAGLATVPGGGAGAALGVHPDAEGVPTFASQFWALHGLDALTGLFRAGGEGSAAADAEIAREELSAVLGRAIDESLGVARLLPAIPGGPFDADAVRNLVAAELDLDVARQAWAGRLATQLAATAGSGGVRDPGGRGLSIRETVRLTRAEIRAHDEAAVARRLAWMAGAGSHPGWWPTVINPRTGGGSAGRAADLGVSAAVLLLARDLAVGEHAKGLDLLRVVPDRWLGQNLEVHGLPTAWGMLSYAIRWHGERPALLWELADLDEGDAGGGLPGGRAGEAGVAGHDRATVEVRCPGLDPEWSSAERSGDVLLSPVEPRGDDDAMAEEPSAKRGAVEADATAMHETTNVSLRVAPPTRRPGESAESADPAKSTEQSP